MGEMHKRTLLRKSVFLSLSVCASICQTITHGYSVVRVIENNFHKRRDNSWSGSLVKQRLALFWTEIVELIAEYKLDSCVNQIQFIHLLIICK